MYKGTHSITILISYQIRRLHHDSKAFRDCSPKPLTSLEFAYKDTSEPGGKVQQ